MIIDSATRRTSTGARRFGRSRRPAATSSCSGPRPSPTTARRSSAPVLDELGAWDLDPRTDADELEAAAALCRSAGYWALPYPVAERLAAPPTSTPTAWSWSPTPSGGGASPASSSRWAAVTLDGRAARSPVTAPTGPGFVAELDLAARRRRAPATWRWRWCCRAGRCSECSTGPWNSPRARQPRQQFGQPLAAFQGVQFQLTDAEVERVGLEVLAKYALWSVGSGRPEALDDALALRMAAIEAADVVFRVTHQLHGAIGFCDETTLSWLSRYSQPLRRLPFGLSATRDVLTRTRRADRGLDGVVRVTRPRRVPRRRCARGAPSTSPPTGARRRPASSDAEFVAFQKAWFAELHAAGLRRAALAAPSGAAACRSPSRSCSTRSWPPTTRPGWCWRSSGSTTRRRRCWPRAPTSSADGTCPPSSTARSGCRASPNPRPAPTWPACAPRHGGTATTSSSTARSSGPAAACTPTGACCWPAPTPTRRSARASRTS